MAVTGAASAASAELCFALLTTTTDLNAEFPAYAARRIGWVDVPLLCSHDMNVTLPNPRGVPMAISRRMRRIALQGIAVGLGTSVALMAVAALGYVTPAVGALLQEALDAAVILNALRVR